MQFLTFVLDICMQDDLDTGHHCPEHFLIAVLLILRQFPKILLKSLSDNQMITLFILLEETSMAWPACTSKLLIGSCMSDTY
jgi:hypothetical protein